MMTSNGTNVRELNLPDSLDVRGMAAWSPDGRWVAVVADENDKRRLFKVPVDGGDAIPLVTGWVSNPLWARDGSLILYRARTGPSSVLRAVTPEGKDVSIPKLTFTASALDGYQFVPGTRKLITLHGDGIAQNFWLFDLDTGTQRQVTNLKPGLRVQSFDISPDGKQILFDRWRDATDVVVIERARP